MLGSTGVVTAALLVMRAPAARAEVPEILSDPGLYPPAAPRAPAAVPGTVTATSLVLGWEAPPSVAGNLDGFAVQTRLLGSGDAGWRDAPGGFVTGVEGSHRREVQTVVSRADAHGAPAPAQRDLRPGR